METDTHGAQKPTTIKKYANRRLYNTSTSSYVTLEHLSQMVKQGEDFVVTDAKTGEDITRTVLTQIIVEEEAKGQNLLPIEFLRQIIGFYGNNMQWMLPGYLNYAMKSFEENQDRMNDYFRQSFGGMFPLNPFEEMSKQNMAIFDQAMRMFSPFAEAPPGPPAPHKEAPAEPAPAAPQGLEDLKARVDQLQKQLEAIAGTAAAAAAEAPPAKPADRRRPTAGRSDD